MTNFIRTSYIMPALCCIMLCGSTVFGMQQSYYQCQAYNDIVQQLRHQQIIRLLNSNGQFFFKLNRLIEQEAEYNKLTRQEALDNYLILCLLHKQDLTTIYALEHLIQLGANVNCRYKSNNQTPLILAAEKRSALAVSILINNGADTTAQDENGDTTLTFAARTGKLDIVKLLVQTTLNEAYRQQQQPITSITGHLPSSHALQTAADDWQDCPLEILDCCIRPFLPSDIDQQINHQNNLGNTALICAATRNYREMVEFLLENGADAWLTNNAGQTAADLATNADVKSLLQRYMQ
jgi:ankyrin repeat protein